MPVLPMEPFVFPQHLLAGGEPALASTGPWWVLHTKPRAEKALARRLLCRDVSFFLPLFQRVNRTNGRVQTAHLPLFPGYLFLNGNADDRYIAQETNLVARCLAVTDEDRLLSDLTRVHQLMLSDAELQPEHRLAAGALVEIVDGPLAGITGKVLRRGKQLRFFIEVDLLQRGFSIELDRWMFRPVD